MAGDHRIKTVRKMAGDQQIKLRKGHNDRTHIKLCFYLKVNMNVIVQACVTFYKMCCKHKKYSAMILLTHKRLQKMHLRMRSKIHSF